MQATTSNSPTYYSCNDHFSSFDRRLDISPSRSPTSGVTLHEAEGIFIRTLILILCYINEL